MKVELRTVVLDITKHCLRVPKHIKQIYEVHIYDAGLHMHLCELTPSAELHYVCTDFIAAESYYDLSEDKREEVYEYVQEIAAHTELITYMHMSSANRISGESGTRCPGEEPETREEILQETIECMNCDPETCEWEKILNENKKERS